MIHIEQGQTIAENDNLRVSTATGDYGDNALIEFYDASKPDVIAGSFQAQYVKYGGMVYRFNDPKDLGAAILTIDASSTHTAASYVRMTRELESQLNEGSLDQVVGNEQAALQDQQQADESATEATSTSALSQQATTTPQTASTTPSVNSQNATSTQATSTPQTQTASIADAFTQQGTTTPAIDFSPDVATSTASTTPQVATSTADMASTTPAVGPAATSTPQIDAAATSTPAGPLLPDVATSTPAVDVSVSATDAVDAAVASSTP